jgi:hypothetical protein
MRLLKTISCAAVLAALHLAASAAPVEFKDGPYLTWLTLAETENLSINDILNGVGGWNQTYRFATTAEVDAMLLHQGLYATDYAAWTTSRTGDFVNNIGGTDQQTGMAGTYFSQGNAGAWGHTLNMAVYVNLTNGDWPFDLSPACPAYVNCSNADIFYQAQDMDARSESMGNFLVRIPEPGSFALLGLAGVLLAARRRKPLR